MNRHLFLQLAVLFIYADNSYAGVFDGGKITGHGLAYCVPLNVGGTKSEENLSLGVGFAYDHYVEDSKFWYGSRSEWDGCAGKFASLGTNRSTDKPEDAEISVYEGDFFEFSYLPLGGTLLPGLYFTPGLVWIPSIYASLGFTGALEVTRKQRYIVKGGYFVREEETPRNRYAFLIAPTVNIGAQARFYLIDIFGEARLNYYVGAPSEFVGGGITILAGVSVSFVN